MTTPAIASLRILLRCLAFIVAVTWACAAWAGGFSRADDPAWVDRIALPGASDAERAPLLARASDGILTELVDSQVRWDDAGRKLTYFRLATRVTDRAGLEEAATISIDYDPAFEDLALTRLDVVRGGAATSLRDSLQEEIVRRETRLEAGIIDGSLTVVLQVPGLKVGDIVDYSVVLAAAPPFPGAPRSVRVSMEYSDPVVLVRHVIHWPKDRPWVTRPVPDRVARGTTDEGAATRHEWRRSLNAPVTLPDRLPVEYDPFARVQYGEDGDWGGLVAALRPYYDRQREVPAAWRERIAVIARDHADPGDRAIAALRLVQNEVRYVGIEVGAGGYFARPPETVVDQGFGDCKDKALLLVTLLRALGIAADVALADLDQGYGLSDVLPGAGAFDHMIVRARLDGRFHWFDPTDSHAGGTLALAVSPDYGLALPLADGVTALAPIEVNDAGSWQTDVTEAYDFSWLGVSLVVTTVYRGAAADSWRYQWATTPAADIGRRFLDFYDGRYPGMRQATAPTAMDDPDRNSLVMTERYFIPATALRENGLETDFPFGAEDFSSSLRDAVTLPRAEPLLIGGARTSRHRVEIRNPPIRLKPPETIALSNKAFSFRFEGANSDDGSTRLEWTFRSRARTAGPGDIPAVLADARRIAENTVFWWDLTPEDGGPPP